MKVAALVDDMFFGSKLSATARALGADIVFCRSADTVPPDTARVCVDLNATAFDAVAEIRKLKAAHAVPITAFVSHIQVDLKRVAEQAGADEVIARSVFSDHLSEILSRA
jgi:hypothetical protein